MPVQRTDRLNSLLKEVISDVIRREVRNPYLTELLTVTRVEITKDLRHAKVFISVIGSEQEKEETLSVLNTAAGFIAIQSSKQVVMRYFPDLTFYIDNTVERQIRIEELLAKIQKERETREPSLDDSRDDESL